MFTLQQRKTGKWVFHLYFCCECSQSVQWETLKLTAAKYCQGHLMIKISLFSSTLSWRDRGRSWRSPPRSSSHRSASSTSGREISSMQVTGRHRGWTSFTCQRRTSMWVSNWSSWKCILTSLLLSSRRSWRKCWPQLKFYKRRTPPLGPSPWAKDWWQYRKHSPQILAPTTRPWSSRMATSTRTRNVKQFAIHQHQSHQ